MLKTNIIALKTLVSKEVRRFMRIWVQTLLPSAISTLLYFLIFGSLIGARIGAMDGIQYIDYIVPGLIMMAVINNAYSNVVGSFYGAKFQHSIEELLVSPASNFIILLGYVVGGTLRGLFVGIIVLLISMLFTSYQIHNLFLMITVVLLTSILFSSAGLVNAIFARNFDDVSFVPTFVLSPLTYLGGVFYSINLLPEFWKTISLANPILYMVNAFRYSFLGVSDINIVPAVSLIIIMTLLMFFSAWYLLGRSVGLRK